MCASRRRCLFSRDFIASLKAIPMCLYGALSHWYNIIMPYIFFWCFFLFRSTFSFILVRLCVFACFIFHRVAFFVVVSIAVAVIAIRDGVFLMFEGGERERARVEAFFDRVMRNRHTSYLGPWFFGKHAHTQMQKCVKDKELNYICHLNLFVFGFGLPFSCLFLAHWTTHRKRNADWFNYFFITIAEAFVRARYRAGARLSVASSLANPRFFPWRFS